MRRVLFWAGKLILFVRYLVNYYGAKTCRNLQICPSKQVSKDPRKPEGKDLTPGGML